jgi:type I restriction enzyme S subunit
MAAEWTSGQLGDCVVLQSGGTPSKSRSDFWVGNIPWVSAKDMKSYWIEDTEDHLSEKGAKEATRIVAEGTTLLLVRGMTLHNDIPICRVRRSAAFNQDVKAVLARAGTDREFVPYLLLGNKAKLLSSVDSAGHGTGRLNSDTLLNLPVCIPPLQEQSAIAHILGTLDDKIELNRRMNETLETMARAIFKSWFVDVDPVRAKAESRDPGLPKHIADLFPDRFEVSELGEIPAGWNVESIYNVADVVYGAPFASSQFNTDGIGKPLIRIRDLVDESPGVWTPEIHPKGYMVRPGNILVGMDGEFRAYLWGGSDAWLNQRVCVFVPKSGYSVAFVRNSILDPLAHVEATESATTVIHIGKNDIDRFSIVVPSSSVLEAFNKHCQPWYDRIVAGKRESRTLATLRDTLLPKLISGELRVQNEKRFLEGVVS